THPAYPYNICNEDRTYQSALYVDVVVKAVAYYNDGKMVEREQSAKDFNLTQNYEFRGIIALNRLINLHIVKAKSIHSFPVNALSFFLFRTL
ncbi:MAG: hypothetical protein RLZZ69_1343, partial [Cyanobacteriota bacterium]